MAKSNEKLARTVVAISDVIGEARRADQNIPKWFISFGALLWFIRDRLLGVPLEQDIDISMFYGDLKRDYLIGKFREYGYELRDELLENYGRRPLKMTFKPTDPSLYKVDIDIFFWIVGKKYCWHTYDMYNRGKTMLDEYQFKGTPREYLMGDTVSHVWEEIAPTVKLPEKYGSLLDTWYPPQRDADGKIIPGTGWLVRNRKYGQSKCDATRNIKDCKNLLEQLQ